MNTQNSPSCFDWVLWHSRCGHSGAMTQRLSAEKVKPVLQWRLAIGFGVLPLAGCAEPTVSEVGTGEESLLNQWTLQPPPVSCIVLARTTLQQSNQKQQQNNYKNTHRTQKDSNSQNHPFFLFFVFCFSGTPPIHTPIKIIYFKNLPKLKHALVVESCKADTLQQNSYIPSQSRVDTTQVDWSIWNLTGCQVCWGTKNAIQTDHGSTPQSFNNTAKKCSNHRKNELKL